MDDVLLCQVLNDSQEGLYAQGDLNDVLLCQVLNDSPEGLYAPENLDDVPLCQVPNDSHEALYDAPPRLVLSDSRDCPFGALLLLLRPVRDGSSGFAVDAYWALLLDQV